MPALNTAVFMLMEHLRIKEEQSVESLVLCRGGDMAIDRQITEKQLDFGCAWYQVLARAHLMKPNVAANPVTVAPLCTDGLMSKAQHLADLVHELKLGIRYDSLEVALIVAKSLVCWDLTTAILMHTLAYARC